MATCADSTLVSVANTGSNFRPRRAVHVIGILQLCVFLVGRSMGEVGGSLKRKTRIALREHCVSRVRVTYFETTQR